MKKSQVLAALALAMALGVVAPVASTFATYGGTTAEQEASEKVVEDAVKSAEDLADYDGYYAVYDAIKDLDEAVKTGNETALVKLRTELGKITDVEIKEGTAPDEKVVATLKVADVFGSVNINSTTYTYATLSNVVNGWINNQRKTVQAGEATNATAAQKNNAKAAQQMIANLEGALNEAEEAGDFDTAYDTAVKAILAAKNDDGKDLFNTTDIVATNGKYTKANYETVKARATASPYSTYAALFELVDEAKGMKASTTIYSPATVADRVTKIDNIVAQIKRGDFTTVKPGDAGDAQKPTTPDTGANTASEESATASVSILSGVASVVTAAGVVIRKAFRK